MKEMQRLLSRVRFAVDKYNMIEDGDHIVVGISGGKDSLALLCTLAEMRVFYPQKYTLSALTVDMGFSVSESIAAPAADYSGIRELCRRLDVPYVVKQTEIARVIFDIRKESNPCSLCARMRRGVIHDEVKALGANKLALGHHMDDAVETFMMSLTQEGRINCFSPVTELEDKSLTVIRPLIYAEEREISRAVKKGGFEVTKSRCPADGETSRQRMKEKLRAEEKADPGLKVRIFGAIQRGLWGI